jgi:hypothetical protein
VADRLLGQRTQPRLTAVERQLPACEPILGPPVPDGRMAVLAVLSHYGRQAVREREGALALGVRVAVHDSRQNDRQPVIWQPGQDYRMAEDPEVRFTNNGIAVTNLRVAVTPTRPAGRPVARRRDQLL